MKPTLTEEDYINAAMSLNVEVAAVKAVCEVEAPRGGFNPDGSPVTLFEGHWFHRFTNGIYSGEFPEVSYAKWTRKHYGRTWQQEQSRLELACSLNRHAAYLSASWGRFQIMGFNHAVCLFTTVEAFVQAMHANEGEHLRAFIAYIRHRCLDDELREHRWADFARLYNGNGYRENRYDEKMAAAYAKFAA